MIIFKKLMTKRTLVGSALGIILSVSIVSGCTVDTGLEDSQDSDRAKVSQDVSEREGGDSGSEHSSKPESNESSRESGDDVGDQVPSGESDESGNDSSEGGREEHGGTNTLALREGGDTGSEHNSKREGNESGEEGSEDRGEHGSGGDGRSEGSHSSEETSEAAMSSPITPLGQSWNGVLGGLAVSMQYDAATQSVHGTVRNTLSQELCHVQAEPHLKSGTKTVGELGPDRLGHLNPEQEVMSSLTVPSEPRLAGVSYDGYVVHMEVFDCGGPGPSAHSGEQGIEGSSERGPSGETSNETAGTGGEEGRAADILALDETLDAIRGGARLILNYDASSNSFRGTVENTTDGVLERVRVEVHLSNGTELGPTTPTNMAPGEVALIDLPAIPELFIGWTTHAEVGSGEEGSESGGEHQAGGEHGGSAGEQRGEHGSGRKSGGEHGGERRGGG